MVTAIKTPINSFEDDVVAGGLAPSLADATMDLIGEVQGGFNAINATNAKANAQAVMILGFASSLSMITGPILVKRSINEIKISKILNDSLGEILAWIRTGTGVIQSTAGAVFTGMTLAALVFFATSMQVALSAAQTLSIIGGSFLSLAGIFSLFSGFIEFYMNTLCKKILKSEGTNPEEILELIRSQSADPTKKRLFERVLGRELINKILSENTSIPKEKIAAEIQKQLRLNTVRNVLSTLLSLFGSMITICALILTGPTAQLVYAATTLLTGILWVGMDIQEFSSCYSNNPVNTWDKFLIIASAVFCFAIIAVTLSLTTHPGILLLILAAGITLTVIHVLSIYKACFST